MKDLKYGIIALHCLACVHFGSRIKHEYEYDMQ
jgi:hypothetical protein